MTYIVSGGALNLRDLLSDLNYYAWPANSGTDSMEHGEARALHFYKWLGTGAPWVEEQQTRNWPNCTEHHEIAHQND